MTHAHHHPPPADTLAVVTDAVAVPIFHRGAAQTVALAPFALLRRPMLLAVGVRLLKLAPTRDFRVVASLPLAPAAGGHENPDQQAEQKNQTSNDQLVGIGSEAHFASPTDMESRPLRLTRGPRSTGRVISR